MTIYHRVDAVMIERLLGSEGAEQAGIYAQGYRLLDALTQFGFLFAALLLPMFARMLAQAVDVKPLLSVAVRLMLVLAIAVASACFFFRQPIMLWLYGESGANAEIFGLLAISFAGICMMYVFGSLLTANANMRQLNLIACGGLVLNMVLNFWLIPEYMALGAAISAVTTQLLVAVAHMVVAARVFNLRVRWQMATAVCVYALLSVGIAWGAMQIHGVWQAMILLALLVPVMLAFPLGLLMRNDLQDLFRKG
jgi:O-antigen/teichoic acid export membrane protein